ncbi:Peptidase S8 propeptide/proteinase inhibitor I9 [Arabidopsis thaliana x Arabidopsis arenosa]|uniref:Peptidase S8 propeptide/proteinase inhibitor I9 n=1 Tax=Arabidopsis thaliana x Arabidopsis arenosa TaxID=1240361 RepID=A0A8T1YBN5_9BRAS|nr:Peptidase S8 propeptide/proteinase inhibitor I9 [Arabidopsis thaliana x Arabidopsis arenosa]
MASLGLMLCLFSVLLLSLCQIPTAIEDERKVYIAYMGALPSKASYSPMSHHQNILQEVIESSSVEDSLVRSYGRSFNGFSAKLTESERDKLMGMEGVVSVFPNTVYKLLTTRSYEFMGLGDKSNHVPKVESNIIVGVIDGGIWPESKSFSDEGIGPIPKKWKGTCAGGTNFTCNRKVIGARHYVQDSARDKEPHGSHTASTAAGNKVKGVSVNGVAKGTARGAVPLGRIAIYRVCEPAGCNADGMLAAFDDAIADGVDVITISIGGGVTKVDIDPIAIGSFHAMLKGIVTTAAVGNDGSKPGKASNLAPWIISVAAGSTDRKFVTNVVNGEGKTIPGRSINDFDLKGKKYPLAYGKTASSNCTEELARGCASGCLNTVKGKIVVCDVPNDVMEQKAGGAVGTILHVTDVDTPGLGPIAVATLDDSNYEAFRSYVLSSPNPQGTILKSGTVKDNDAPIVASFSSRGPNTLFSDILKPDITAPGVNILAAYTPLAQTALPGQSVDYYFMTGTSMACPHVAGVAAYVKTLRPDWSASAVKSAIMTTAWAMNVSKNADAEFAYGSGYVNPSVAVEPGLVYEIAKEDYLKMLCSLDYSSKGISTLAGGSFTCSEKSKLTMRNLNYPAMTAKVSASSSSDITFSRTVTNVGEKGSTYKAKLSGNPKLSIKVEPETLYFKSPGEKKSFTVTVSGKSLAGISSIVSASLVWSDGLRNVRSPIVVYT